MKSTMTSIAVYRRPLSQDGMPVLRFQIQSGMVVIPKTTHIERMKENLEMFDNEMEILRALDKGQPLIGNPQNPDFVSSSVNW